MQGEANIVWTAVCMWHLYVRVWLSAVSDSVEVCVEGLLLPTADRDIQRSFVSVSQRALPAIIDAAVGPVPVPEHTIVTYLHVNMFILDQQVCTTFLMAFPLGLKKPGNNNELD